MNTNKLNFSFKSSFFAFKNNSKIEIENQKIKADFPNMKFGILQDGNKNFEIEKENIFSMSFSFVSSIIFSFIGAIFIFIGILQLDKIYYQEEYGIYAMISFLLGFSGWIYMYENIIKPKKRLEEMNLSMEFLVRWIFVVISIILFLVVFFKIWFIAIFSGLFLATGILYILSSLSLQFQIVDKKWIAYTFPVLFWQYWEVNRIFRVNFSEFYKEKTVQNTPYILEKNFSKNIENTQIHEKSESTYISARKNQKSDKMLLIGLLGGAMVVTIISYFLPLESGTKPVTFIKIMEAFYKQKDLWGMISLFLPPIFIVILGVITFFKEITGKIKIFANIFSWVILAMLFGLVFFPLHYVNVFFWEMSARDIQRASEDVVFGFWAILLLVSMICIIIYTFKINSKK